MPCSDYGRQTTAEEEKAYLGYNRAELEDAFCSACTELERNGIAVPVGAASVWAAHKTNDIKRKSREEAIHDRAAARQSGLSKLSAQERDAHGLR